MEKNLVYFKSNAETEKIFEFLIDEDEFYNPDGMTIGYIESLEVPTKKTKEGKEFNQLVFNIITVDGKRYKKIYSTDFARKYLSQLGKKASETHKAIVVFKPNAMYKTAAWFAFVGEYEVEEQPYYTILAYENNSLGDVINKLNELGL